MKKYKIIGFILLLALSSCHIGRFAYWNKANTDDYKKFDNLEVSKSDSPFQFNYSRDSIILPETIRYQKAKKGQPKYIDFKEAIETDKTVAIIVLRNDSILFEKYYDDYTPETMHTSFSMAKSYISALIGIAIDEGSIKSVNDKVSEYLPRVNDDVFSKISIKDLLDMQSGLKFNESYFNPFGDVAKYYYGTNLTKYISKLKLEKEPGTEFRYKSVDPQLLAAVLESATGMKISAYFEKKIWSQIGTEADASWSIDSEKNQTEKAFCCMNAIARDYTRFGRLYLNNGNWNGNQIISIDWVKESTIFTENKNNLRYSYQWWHTWNIQLPNDTIPKPELYIEMPFANHPEIKAIVYPGNDYFAQGILGQYTYINPDKNMVIVRLGHKDKLNWVEFFQKVANLN